MRKRIFLIAIILITSIALSFGIGFGIWTIASQNHGSSEGDIEGYTIINLDNISDSTPAFYYNEVGFYDEETKEYSYKTTFTITINATQKDEPYDLVISLISEDNFLSSATITSSSDRNSEKGNDVIKIEQIAEDTNFEVTYTITTTESNYSSLVSCLNANKKVFLHITAETEDGVWSVDKEISLDANVQSLVEVNIPTPHLDSFTYNGQEQYCVENNPAYSELTNNTRTNAGTQTVTVSLKPGYKWSDNTTTNKNIKFTIEKLSLYIDYVQEIPSNSRVYKWENFKTFIVPEFRNSITNEIVVLNSSDYAISGMNDGEYYYGAKVSGLNLYSTSVMGSTYDVSVAISNTNFSLVSADFYLKYQTVLIGNNHYTIEDALSENSGSLITDANTLTASEEGETGIVLSASSALITKFTELDFYGQKVDGKRIYELKASTSGLYVSYDKTTNYKVSDGSNTTNYTGSVLYLPESVVLNANKNIYVAGHYIQNKHLVYQRGVLFNNGLINMNSNLDCFGFIKGIGTIDLASNKMITELLCFYNYVSGGPTLSMSNANIFPLTVYSFHNISCTVIIPFNSKYNIYYDMNMTVTIQGTLTLLGSGGMFELTSGYLIKNVEDTTGSNFSSTNKNNLAKYNLSNQDMTQREVIEIYGSFRDNIVSIQQSGKGITTGPNYAMPIGFMNIKLKDDGNGNVGIGTLSSNSYKFLPGARLEIDSGASLTISQSINVIFYDETYSDAPPSYSTATIGYNRQHSVWYNSERSDKGAQLINNGEIISNGYLGGLIQTTSNTGKMTLLHGSATLLLMTDLTYSSSDAVSIGFFGATTATTVSSTKYTLAYMLKSGLISNEADEIAAASYYAYTDLNGKSGWYASKGILAYNTMGGNPETYPSKEISIGQEGYIINQNDISYEPTRDYYVFDGWYVDSACTELAFNQVIYSGVTLFAKWIPIEYNISYILYDGINSSDNIISYDVESSFVFLNPEKEGNTFLGWYTSNTWEEQITSISPGTHGDIVLHARWISNDENLYEINYISSPYNEDADFQDYTDLKLSISEFELRDYSIKNNNKDYSKYFDGWYIDTDYSYKVTSITQELFTGDTTINLYAKWLNKVVVVMKYRLDNGNVMSMESYLEAGKEFTIPEIPSVVSSIFNIPEGYELVYDIEGGLSDGQKKRTGDSCELSNTWGEEIVVFARKQILTYTVTFKAASNGKVSPTSILNVPYGTTVTYNSNKITINGTTVTATANNNYEFDSWDPQPAKITSNVEITASFKSSGGGGCFTSATEILMADGSIKTVNELLPSDMIMAYDHYSGKLVPTQIIGLINHGYNNYDSIQLNFDNGTQITLLSHHDLYDYTLNKYVTLTSTNSFDFIDHEFIVFVDGNKETTRLVNVNISCEYVEAWSLISYKYINTVANGLLSITPAINKFYILDEFNSEINYDENLINNYKELYGTYTYEEWEQYIPYQIFEGFNFEYVRFAVEKGQATVEDILACLSWFNDLKESGELQN